ncbi:MAG: Fe-S cluster assembly protein IscX [Gammaproteobacteria bacterium]|jgi:FeS assembly protein IscX|nr:Fe-S cluster assembly protein IscX [Gammaproteobacteria bacterium]
MDLRWTDIQDIAIELDELYPQSDPLTINFVDLHAWVQALDGFSDDPARGGEKVLEAIQMAWIEERA